jgi:mono/diheme cytochrome c family protein
VRLAAQDTAVARGAQVYARTCGRCHNPRSPLERTDREWTVIVSHMRVRGNLDGRDSRAVRAFLQAMNESGAGTGATPPAAAAPAAGVEPSATIDAKLADEGKALTQRFNCAACHQIAASTAGTLGPNLNTVLKRRTPAYVLNKLADPRFDNPGSLMPQFGLTPEQRRAILEYLRTLAR